MARRQAFESVEAFADHAGNFVERNEGATFLRERPSDRLAVQNARILQFTGPIDLSAFNLAGRTVRMGAFGRPEMLVPTDRRTVRAIDPLPARGNDLGQIRHPQEASLSIPDVRRERYYESRDGGFGLSPLGIIPQRELRVPDTREERRTNLRGMGRIVNLEEEVTPEALAKLSDEDLDAAAVALQAGHSIYAWASTIASKVGAGLRDIRQAIEAAERAGAPKDQTGKARSTLNAIEAQLAEDRNRLLRQLLEAEAKGGGENLVEFTVVSKLVLAEYARRGIRAEIFGIDPQLGVTIFDNFGRTGAARDVRTKFFPVGGDRVFRPFERTIVEQKARLELALSTLRGVSPMKGLGHPAAWVAIVAVCAAVVAVVALLGAWSNHSKTAALAQKTGEINASLLVIMEILKQTEGIDPRKIDEINEHIAQARKRTEDLRKLGQNDWGDFFDSMIPGLLKAAKIGAIVIGGLVVVSIAVPLLTNLLVSR